MVLGGSGLQWVGCKYILKIKYMFTTVNMLEYFNGKPWLSGTHGNKLLSEQMCVHVEVMTFKIFGICDFLIACMIQC